MRFFAKSAVLSLIFLAFAKLGLVFGTVGNGVTVFWPPSGIALATLIMGGWAYLPAIVVGATISGILMNVPVAFTVGSIVGPVLEASMGYFLVSKVGGIPWPLGRTRDLFSIIVLGGIAAAIISAIIGPTTLWLSGLVPLTDLPAVVWRWWRGDVLGVTFFTPLILVFAKNRFPAKHEFRVPKIFEIALLWLACIVVAQMAFLDLEIPYFSSDHSVQISWVFPLLVWSGLRAGRRNTALIQTLFLLHALQSALTNSGFFADEFSQYGLANFWLFAMLMATIGMALAIQSEEQRAAYLQTFNATSRLFESERRYRTLVEWSPEAIFVQRDGTLLYANPAARALAGRNPDSTQVDVPLLDVIHPKDRELALEWLRSFDTSDSNTGIGTGPNGQMVELNVLRPDGRVLDIEMRGITIHFDDGIAVQVLARDVTTLKAQQRQIKLISQVFEQSREGITIADASGNILMVNKAFTHVTGYTEAEVIGKNPNLLSSGRQSKAFYAAMWESIHVNGFWTGEIWNRRKDGQLFPEWLAISALRGEDGSTTNYVGSFSDLSEAKAAESRIQWLSHFDAITGLPNRVLLQDRTKHAIAMAQRTGEALAMMLVSINHFKAASNIISRAARDDLLVAIGNRLGRGVRDQDTVAHIDAEDFVLVLPQTSQNGAAHLAMQLMTDLAQIYAGSAADMSLATSIGISLYPDNGEDFDSLFMAAEIAVERARALDGDNIRFYNMGMYLQVQAHDQLLKGLRSAIELDQLSVHYQPLVDLETGHISGLEALLRWEHPVLGSISPTQFIPLAEESGLINSVGRWVMGRACQDMRKWIDKGIQVPPVAINVSPLQFRDHDLPTQLHEIACASQIDTSFLYLEVTESALMDDVPRSETALRKMRDLGFKLSLDDFGTGYSSLSYLKRFPFDKVKIDQSFVRDIATTKNDEVLVNVIVSMAHGLGLRVIAEGVETEAQCAMVRTGLCDEIQGYLFSKAIPSQEIEQILSERRQLPLHMLRMYKAQRTLLLVDDEPNIVASLKRLFRGDGISILTAHSGEEGLELLSKNQVDIIISDQRMPGMTGVNFLRNAKQNYPDTIRIVLSGYTDLQSVTDAINEGAVYRFLTKPWDDDQLRDQVQKAFMYKELLEENRRLDVKVRTANQELISSNRQLSEALEKLRQKVATDAPQLSMSEDKKNE